MRIHRILLPADKISFTYKSVLKDEWRSGNLPTVTRDIYGDRLHEPISVEHNIPHSLGGKDKLRNYSLANTAKNNTRGSEPLLKYTTIDNIKQWYAQFLDVRLSTLNGKQYIENGLANLKQIGINISMDDVKEAGKHLNLKG